MAKTENDAKKAVEGLKGKQKKGGKTHLFVLMDETGSMHGTEEAVVTGCNEFLHSFKDQKGVRVWMGLFDAHPGEPRLRLIRQNEKIKNVADLTMADYKPRGMTPLNDAIADSVQALDKVVSKDDTVFLAIITDGGENSSEISGEAVKKLLTDREQQNGWGIVFLGANQNAERTAAGYGLVGQGKAFNFKATKGGVKGTMRSVTHLARSRSAAPAGVQGLRQYEEQASVLYAATGGKIEEVDDE